MCGRRLSAEDNVVFLACISIGEFATGAYNDPKTRSLIMDMRLNGASDTTCLHALASLAEEDWMREAIWAEFNQLPRTTITQVLDTWTMAAKAGKTWEVSSEEPERIMEFARTKKVRLVTETDDAGIRLVLSHVATRHAQWYRVDAPALA